MKKMKIEMPLVKACDMEKCGFNSRRQCHAKAITIGDGRNPGCDTFFDSPSHSQGLQVAGVGACKVSDCVYNDDFECSADNISVGMKDGSVKCQTFLAR